MTTAKPITTTSILRNTLLCALSICILCVLFVCTRPRTVHSLDYEAGMHFIIWLSLLLMVLSYGYILAEPTDRKFLTPRSRFIIWAFVVVWLLFAFPALPVLLFPFGFDRQSTTWGPCFEAIVFSFPLTTVFAYLFTRTAKHPLAGVVFDCACCLLPVIHLLIAIFAAR
jgi:hypothetical protein